MSIFGAMNIAYTGLVVDRKWLDSVSDNLSNINNVSPTSGNAFQARYIVARANQYGNNGGSYVAGTLFGDPKGRVVSDPTHPLADADGNVRVPDIDMGSQMAQLMIAQRSYQANLAVVDRSKSMYEAAIGIGK
ncbi:Flagellar basal-body rod protein FlgC [Austwickia sp. TVS 96-490-7B]|uniref:flagellar basal body rod protein FlgC n=1 Tax=Austwickia sp. TVS 96-490-7B TaxID=2830843 RepID=UPI001C5A16AC|nr:flagellar basal body rod C-terminal domain-containing protein [Austwickia sp. TVS 96-490-7B]MBW3083938.1 Flagellar basal-body rod protein FlgC [Austwickia sp. TVS 96-490-7B]